jgi:alpha-tubulin suppressor-like RCC1 family protein
MDGALWCWGADDLGQVSAGPALGADKPCTLAKCDAPRPTRMTLADVKDVRAGVDFTCALDGSGVVHCWGKGTDGELGTDAATDAHEVVAVSGTYAALLGGGTGMCAEPTAGDPPVCWGHVPRTSAPPKVFGPITLPAAADSGMQAFDFGASFGCGIGPAGQRVCWGNDTSGALGNGVQGGNSLTPTDLGGDEIQLTAAGNHGCAVTATGGVECWGENFREQCGQNGANVLTPTAVTVDGFNPLVGCAEVVQSNLVSCVRCAATSGPARTDVLCWGEHDTGGGGTVATPNGQPRSLALAGMHDFSELAVYARGGCALDAQGKLFCWGTGYHGENGDGGHAANLPTPILAPTN